MYQELKKKRTRIGINSSAFIYRWYQITCKYLDKSLSVFYAPLKAGLQPAAHCRRVADPARAMLVNLWPST